MRSQRIDNMMQYIRDHKSVSLDKLCEEFDVSKNTVRRDLSEILATGEFKKIYGGITVTSSSTSLSPFEERNIRNQSIKENIAKKAASFVCDDDIIFIDSGTTTFYMIEHLKDKKNITILTNNLEAILRAVPYPEMNIVSLSGNLNHKTLSFTGSSAAEVLSNYNISKAFMASTGVSIEGGVTNSEPLEHDIKKTAVSKSLQTYLLLDHSKYDVISLLTYSSFSSIDILISDKLPPDKLHKHMQMSHTEIILY